MSEEQLKQKRRERRIFNRLKRSIKALDELDRQRDELLNLINLDLRGLAKARGMSFIRLDAVKAEISNG